MSSEPVKVTIVDPEKPMGDFEPVPKPAVAETKDDKIVVDEDKDTMILIDDNINKWQKRRKKNNSY